MLNWDLFTGMSTDAQVRAAAAGLERMLAVDRKTTRQVQLEVKSAYLNLTAAQARCRVSRASLASADQSLTLVQRQFDGGAATVTRYLEAELDLTRARQGPPPPAMTRPRPPPTSPAPWACGPVGRKFAMPIKVLNHLLFYLDAWPWWPLILYTGGFF